MWRSSLLLAPQPRLEAGFLPVSAAQVQSRIRELERERSEAAREAEQLLAVQRAIVRIVAAPARDVVANLLRGAYALGYARAIYYIVDGDGVATHHAHIDGNDRVEQSYDSTMARRNARAAESHYGSILVRNRAQALPAVKHARGAYTVSPLVHEGRTLGILYVDDRRATAARGGDERLDALTTVAAATLGNSTLLAGAIELATIDPLTGLLNRRAVTERISAELEMCRNGSRALTYVMVDVDDLKIINDTRGHAEGDETLKKVAAVLRRSSRAQDVVGRFGGDEFVIVLSGVDRALGRALVKRLSQNLRAQNLSCSIGAALLGAEASDEPSLTRCADRALYAAKAAGKNCFSFA